MRKLSEASFDPDPIRQFRKWYTQVLRVGIPEPSAMALSTATPDGKPSSRMVLMKDFGERGFVFFTNYESRKGCELAANPNAALLFYWPQLDRQVRITGSVKKVSAQESDTYWMKRPPLSRIGAIASDQSRVIPSRDVLAERVQRIAREHPDGNPPRPTNWGGFCIWPLEMEFWQSQPNRLHDRLRYRRSKRAESGWILERLAP